MNYASIKYPDVANGLGVRVSLFVSGCTHHCRGCFNPETWDFGYGNRFSKEKRDYIYKILENKWVQGLSILGGEPFDNATSVYWAFYRIKELYPDKDLWIYSGYKFEEIINSGNEKMLRLLMLADVLVDGEFILDKKNVNLRFRGSENQRIIDVQRSLKLNSVVIYDLEE